jgi:DNA-binding NarL/FixJ family response regulator
MSKLRVLIADDQPLMRAGFRTVLEATGQMEVVGEAEDGEQAVQAARSLRPDVLLMDIRMPNLDGIEATRRLPGHKILILTTFGLDDYIVDALRAGASGFILKDVPAEELVRAVRVVAAGDALLSPEVTRRLLDRVGRRLPAPVAAQPDALADLTEREREVLELLARGLSNSEIAAALVVGEATVKTHVSRVLAKLGLRDRVQAVVLAYEIGLISPGTP